MPVGGSRSLPLEFRVRYEELVLPILDLSPQFVSRLSVPLSQQKPLSMLLDVEEEANRRRDVWAPRTKTKMLVAVDTARGVMRGGPVRRASLDSPSARARAGRRARRQK